MLKLLTSLLFVSVFFSGCENTQNVAGLYVTSSVSGDIIDTPSWYYDANTDVLKMYVYVPEPNALLCSPHTDQTAPVRPCLLEDINADRYNDDAYTPVLQVAMYTDKFNTSRQLNAEMKLRGNYSRTLDQKSYAVKLDSKVDLLLDQRKFQINKHRSDQYRVKNRLAFDLFQEMANFPTIKMQFVNLFINGEDLGVFTHAETIREEYLTNRQWNVNDRLYSSVLFYWEPDDKLKTDENGKPLDEAGFNSILEIKAGKEHSLVNEMLLAIENTSDIDSVIDKYFNRDNFLTWLAINLLISNKDTTYHNYYLYNPLYSEIFYFIPWDYDGAWANTASLSRNEEGIELWWQSTLHRKFLRIEKNRNDMYEKIAYLRRTVITDANIIKKLESYEHAMIPEHGKDWLKSAMALAFRPATNIKHKLGIDRHIEVYERAIGRPMPFDVSYTYVDGILKLSWSVSEDLEGDDVVYDVQVSTEPSMVGARVFEMLGTTVNSVDIPNLNDGETYYAKVVSREIDVVPLVLDENTHWQIPFNVYYDSPSRTKYFGLQEIILVEEIE